MHAHRSRSARYSVTVRSVLLTASAVLISTLGAAAAGAQKTGLIVVAHGSDSAWNAGVRKTVDQVRWTHGPVKTAWLMGDDSKVESWDNAVNELQKAGVDRIVAVPFMVSTHGSHVRQVEFYAGVRKELPPELESMMAMMGHNHSSHVTLTVPVSVTTALDDAPELGEALAARWNILPASDKRRPLMLIAHGPQDSTDAVLWERNISAVVSELARQIAPHPVSVGLLRDDADPEVRAASVASFRAEIERVSGVTRDSVLVLPVLISTGSINHAKIPADIAGLPVRYSPVGLTPSSSLARWVERIAESALQRQKVEPQR